MQQVNWPELNSIHTIIFDFDGVFTDNKVYVAQDGTESVRCDRGDGLGFDFLRATTRLGRLDADIFILSKEKNPVVQARASKLKIKCINAVSDKLTYLEDYLQQKNGNVDFKGIVYLGNDLNDLPIMVKAGFSVAPADAHPRVKEIATVVLNENGGEGFIRSFIEKLLKIETMSQEQLYELIHNS